MLIRRRRVVLAGAAAGLALCAGPAKLALASGSRFIPAQAGFTGEAALAMALGELGGRISPAQVFALGGVDPAQGRGADAEALVRAAEALGATANLWTAEVKGDAGRGLMAALADLESVSDALLLELSKGDFVVLRGLRMKRVRFDDPRVGADQSLHRRELARRWPQEHGAGRRVRAVTLRVPRELPAGPSLGGRIPGIRVAKRVRELGIELAGRGWPVAVVGPFVLTGNLSEERLGDYAESLVQMALDRLRMDFFSRDPSEPVVAYLFADDVTYRRHTIELFGEEPETPFGYYDGAKRALVMNIATGGGTMVHEMIHPLLRANFPGASPWLDEGLASLFEQCRDRDGRLVGMPNWRLPGLHHALRAGVAPSFEELLASDAKTFYGEERGTNYALARYLLFYLQEKGVLVELWRRLVAGGARADGGLPALAGVVEGLGFSDLGAFRRAWESFVLGVHYP